MNKQKLLECKNISHKYEGASKLVLNSISLELNPGELLDISGPSGSGKSTLLSIIGGLLPPSSGNVLLSGNDLPSLSRNKLSELHRKLIGFLFQHYFLLPDLTIRENIELKATIAGMTPVDIKSASEKWLDILQLTHRADAYPNTLSGGEQQRAGLIRAVIHSPALLLCDEPTGNLDLKNRDLIINSLITLKESKNIGIIVVSHDPVFSDISDKSISLT